MKFQVQQINCDPINENPGAQIQKADWPQIFVSLFMTLPFPEKYDSLFFTEAKEMSSYISVCVMVIFLTQHGRQNDKNWKKRYNKIEFGKEELSGWWKQHENFPPFVSLFFGIYFFNSLCIRCRKRANYAKRKLKI